jgi:general stress protein 26
LVFGPGHYLIASDGDATIRQTGVRRCAQAASEPRGYSQAKEAARLRQQGPSQEFHGIHYILNQPKGFTMSLADNAANVNRLLAAAAETIGKVRYCWLLSATAEGGIRPRPMGRVPRDADEDEWTLRFITDGRSPKVADMRRVGQVSVIFQDDPDEAFVALAGKASLVEGKSEIGRRWTAYYDSFFPAGSDRSSAVFITIDVARVELWIRGVTPEPFGLRTTVIERDATRCWHLKAS